MQRPSNAKGAQGVKHLQSNTHNEREKAQALLIQTILVLFTELSGIKSSKDRNAPVENSEARELRQVLRDFVIGNRCLSETECDMNPADSPFLKVRSAG